MNEKDGVVDFKLDALTKSVRFAAGIGPKTVTRVGLGFALALEDSATDPAGELLGIKLHEGASALASSIGSIASSVREGVRSKAELLNAADGPISKVPALESAREFVVKASTEVKDAWSAAGYVAVQVERAASESPDAALTSAGSSPSSVIDPIAEEGVIA